MRFAYFVSQSCHDAAESPAETIRQAREQMHAADEAGFDILWFPEHHFVRSYTSPAPLMSAVDAAHRVKHAKVGTAVILTTFHNPLITAGEIGLASHLTDGRLEVGFARGGSIYEFDRMGLTQQETVERNYESMQVLLGLLRNEEFEHHGKYWSFPPTTTIPRPLDNPKMPIWMASRSLDSVKFAVENELGMMITIQLEPIERLKTQLRLVNAVVDELEDYPRPQISFSRMAYVTDSRADALEAMTHAWNTRAIGYQVHHGTANGRAGHFEPQAWPDGTVYSQEDLAERLVVGDAETVIEKLKIIEAMGVDQFVVYMDFGQPHDMVMRSLEMFVEKVMPAFQEEARPLVGAGAAS